MGRVKARILSVQVIRAIAFVLIFLSHAKVIATGSIGVSLFIVLSGFCMTYAYIDRSEKILKVNFINNLYFACGKIKKLYPLHIITLLFVSVFFFVRLILHKSSGEELFEQSVYFIANGLLLQSWIPWRDGYFSFNAVSWYLSTIAFSYFLFPWVFKIIQLRNNKRIIILAISTLGIMILIAIVLGIGRHLLGWKAEFIKWVTYICPFYRVGDFIIGLVAGYFFCTRGSAEKTRKNLYTVFECAVIFLMIIQVIIYNRGLQVPNWMYSLYWLPVSIMFIYLLAKKNGIISSCLSKSEALIWLGDISGEAFLIHQICIKIIETTFKGKMIIVVVSFVLTIICTVIWRHVHQKYLNEKLF